MKSLDTNVLIYAFDPYSDPRKHKIAKKLLAKALTENWLIASQVYGEFFSACVRKGIATREAALEVVTTWKMLMPEMASSSQAHANALLLASKHQLQYWDALIFATCSESKIKQIYTEDLPGIKKPLGVLCKNPFAD